MKLLEIKHNVLCFLQAHRAQLSQDKNQEFENRLINITQRENIREKKSEHHTTYTCTDMWKNTKYD